MDKLEPRQSDIDFVIAFFTNGQFQKALSEALRLLKNYPQNALLHNITGACYMELGKFESAIKSYNLAISFKSDYAKAYYNLGAAFHEVNQFKDSIESFKKSIFE